MSLSPGNKSSDSCNFYLQKDIARWEPSLKELNMDFANKFQEHPLSSYVLVLL